MPRANSEQQWNESPSTPQSGGSGCVMFSKAFRLFLYISSKEQSVVPPFLPTHTTTPSEARAWFVPPFLSAQAHDG